MVVFLITLSLSNHIICLTENLFVVKSSENEKIIGQIVRSGKWCDQNGDRVSKSDKSYYICMIRLLVRHTKYGTMSIYNYWHWSDKGQPNVAIKLLPKATFHISMIDYIDLFSFFTIQNLAHFLLWIKILLAVKFNILTAFFMLDW